MPVAAVVFDLDLTLWTCAGTWIDCCQPPFRQDAQGVVRDASGGPCRFFHDVPDIFDACDARGLPMAIASRTQEPEWAREVLTLLGVIDRFAVLEIYPGGKTRHLTRIADALDVRREDIVFFDDEYRNIRDTQALGVQAIHTPDGLSRGRFEAALGAVS